MREGNLKSFEGSVVVKGMVHSLLDYIPEMLCIGAHEINSFWWSLKHGRNFCKPICILTRSFTANLLHLGRG